MDKNTLYVGGLVALGIYYGYDTLYPQYKGWETEIIELQKNLSQARTTAPQLVAIRGEEKELEEKLKQSLTRLPSGAELADLISLVIPVMEKVGISIDQIGTKSVDPEQEKEIYRVHILRFSGVAGVSLANVIDLLHELRNFERIINVTDFTFTQDPAAEGARSASTYTLSINLETYSYIDDTSEGGAAP